MSCQWCGSEKHGWLDCWQRRKAMYPEENKDLPANTNPEDFFGALATAVVDRGNAQIYGDMFGVAVG